MLKPTDRLAVFMDGYLTLPAGKMGSGVLRYSPNEVVCIIDVEHAGGTSGQFGFSRDVPIVADVAAAADLGANVLVLGIAPPGGAVPAEWFPIIDAAVSRRLSVVNGLHDRLAQRFATQPGQWIWDIRTEPEGLTTGKGAAAELSVPRILTVGTDMAVGKMTAGLEIQKALVQVGVAAGFVATGQIGMTITGAGVPLDAIRLDFASGAIEREVLASAKDNDLVIIEGQGSLVHPASTATLPLLRGSCPTHLILCVRAGQTHLRSAPTVTIPPLADLLQLYLDLASACGTFPRPIPLAVCVNTAHIKDAASADGACAEIEDELWLPAFDPIRHGCGKLLDFLQTI